MRRRDKLFQRMICNPTEENKENYRKLRNEVTHSIRCAKRDYNYEKLAKNPSMKKLYQVLKNEKHNYQPPLKKLVLMGKSSTRWKALLLSFSKKISITLVYSVTFRINELFYSILFYSIQRAQ